MQTTLSRSAVRIAFAALAAAVITSALLLLHTSTTQLRQENARLQQELVEYTGPAENGPALQAEPPPMAAEAQLSDDEQRELLRLRGEVGLLRSEMKQFESAQAARSRGPVQSPAQPANPALGTLPEYLPRESLAFAGYESADAAVQSGFWANTTLDGKTILAGFSPEQQEAWLKVHLSPEGVAAQIARCPVGANMEKVKGFRILNKQTPSADEVYYTIYVDGLGLGFKEKYKRIGSEWKFDGEYAMNWNP